MSYGVNVWVHRRRNTLFNVGYLKMVEVRMIFSFLFSVFQQTERQKVIGYNG